MIARLGLLLLLVLVVWFGGSTANAGVEIPSILIYLDDFPGNVIHVAPADADAFSRRLSQPPQLPPRPPVSMPYYNLDSTYWDMALRRSPDDPPVLPDGTYYPDGGYVQTVRQDHDVWLVLDLRQRAMLDRYISLGKAGALGPHPGALEVLAKAGGAETISVEIGARPLLADAALAFWRLFDGPSLVSFLDPPRPPTGEGGYWISVTAPEGRILQLFYDPATGSLTDALGTETYRGVVPPGALPSPSDGPLQIEQQPPQGSKLWWPVMLGGGVVLLAAAVWLRRRYS